MAQDEFKAKGPTKASRPEAGGGNTRNVPVIGIVKDNIDPARMGRIKVFLSDDPSTQTSDNSDNWVTVSYLSNFFGRVNPDASNDSLGTYKSNPSSYGEWHAPPDIGTKVICVFVNGDPNYGFYIGCIPEAESLYMVPAIGASDNIIPNQGEADSYGGAVRLPVTNINTNNKEVADSPEFLDSPRPVHSYSASIMNQQGIIRDPIRGPIGSSAQREALSRVGWGVSTPGRPIYEGGFNDETVASNLDPSKSQSLRVVARRGGHSIVMDDGDVIGRDQLIRIRTALGHQILMSDDGQTLMILHSNGQSYIELGKEGTIDMYSTNSVNIRTQGDLNLHADNNVNIHAMEDVNIQAKNFHLNTEEELKLRAGKDLKAYTQSNFTVKADSAVALASGGDSSMEAGGLAYVVGSKVNLNSGSASTQPEEVDIIPLVAQTDTLYDEQKGFMAAPGKLLTIASRAPAHAPWAAAGQGVDIKTDLNASSQLPASPTPATAAATNAGTNLAPPAVSLATAASVPSVPAISGALDKNTTSAVLGTVATAAASGPGLAAVQQGAAIVKDATGTATAAVGSFAQTATQLVNSGIMKPGADTLVKGLVNSGANVAQSMASSLFTGQPGAQNLTNLVQNVTAQATSMVSNMQQAQTALGAVGAITGKEAPAQVAGLVTAAATAGVGPTLNAISQAAGSVGNALANAGATASKALNSLQGAVGGGVSGAVGKALSTIGAGSAAANLATSVTGALGGIAGALKAMGSAPGLSGLLDSAKGVAGSAFAAIKNSFPALKGGVPQNLTAIAQKAAADTAAVSQQVNQLGSSILGAAGAAGAAGLAKGALGSVTNALGTASSIAGAAGNILGKSSPLGSVTNALGAVNNTVSGITGAVTSITNAVNSIPNPTTLINKATGIASVNSIESAVNNAVASVTAVSGAGSSALTQGANSLASAASVIQSGAGAAVSSALASGISNLPGGIKTIGAVVNNASGAINALPGADKIGGLIKTAQSAAMNKLPLPKIPSGVNSLTALAKSGLPAGAAAELSSAISALSSGPAGSIKLPTIGFNTTDRGAITSQITSVLGDPAIPSPNLIGEISEAAKNQAQKILDEGKKIASQVKDLKKLDEQIDKAEEAFYAAQASLPAGDPGLKAAKDKWLGLINNEKKSLLGKIDSSKTLSQVLSSVNAAGSAASTIANAAQTSVSSISGLINAGSSAATGLLSSTKLGGIANATKSLTSVAGLATELTQVASTRSTALSSVAGQGASAVTALQNSQSLDKTALNNSISGILGGVATGPDVTAG